MSMTNPYCNTTSDLQYAFKDIENYSGIQTIEDFTATDGQSNTYQKEHTGYVGIVYEDDAALTVKTSIADVESNASSYYYDSTNDILYVHTSGSDDPDDYTIKVAAEDWNTLKTYMSERAFQQLEAYLDPKYPRPLPFALDQYNSFNYDSDIVECAAILTCINIIKHTRPEDAILKKLQDRVWNANEEIGILWEYRQGLRSFSFECTTDMFDGNVKVISRDSSSSGLIHLAGKGDRTARKKVAILIVTGGAVKTATWKYSVDNKATYSSTLNTTFNYVHLQSGIYIKFTGTFVADDEWEINIAGDPEEVTNPTIKGIELRRHISDTRV